MLVFMLILFQRPTLNSCTPYLDYITDKKQLTYLRTMLDFFLFSATHKLCWIPAIHVAQSESHQIYIYTRSANIWRADHNGAPSWWFNEGNTNRGVFGLFVLWRLLYIYTWSVLCVCVLRVVYVHAHLPPLSIYIRGIRNFRRTSNIYSLVWVSHCYIA